MSTIYYNAEIITMEKDTAPENGVEYTAVLEKYGKIAGVGTLESLRSLEPYAKLRDMEGETIMPGFIDGHSHMVSTSYDLMFANGNPSPKGECDSIEQLIDSLKRQYEAQKNTMKDDSWFMAMGYDESAYPDKALPTKYDMDKVCSDRPMVCMHASGHNGVLNSKAMEICGITDDYQVPAGGGMPKIPGTNEYSGVLQEKALFAQTQYMKMPDFEATLLAVQKSARLYTSYGITTAQDAKTQENDLQLLQAAEKMKMLDLDVACYIDCSFCEKYLPKQDPKLNPYVGHVRYAGYKLFLDGSPQAKTAWLTKPYYIVPDGKDENYCGFPSFTDEEVIAHFETCLKNNWQVNVHTNGDAAIDQFLRCYKIAMDRYPDAMNLRPVFIHCQTVRKDQLEKIKEMGMLISFFEDHVFYWGDYHYESVLGSERAEYISPLKDAMELGINCTLHQDTPVVFPNVILAVHNAVNRRTKSGRVLGADQCVDVYSALKAVTINGAYQLFEEDRKGTLEWGKIADMVVLDKNPLKVAKENIKDIQVLETIKSGKTVYVK